MNLDDLATAIAILRFRGKGKEYLSAEHDIIYFPLYDENDAEKETFERLGMHWSDAGCWAAFV